MYEIVLTDLSYVPQGPVLGASSFQFFRGINKLATVQFQVPLEHTHEDRLSSLTGHIKVYRNKTLQYVGPLISAEEKADRNARSLAITSADAGWVLGKRIVGKSASGDRWTTATARHTIAKTLVDGANTEAETGINTTNYTWSSGSAISYKAGPYGNLLASIQELGNALDGFDWVVRPVENFADGAVSGPKLGSLQIATLIGSNQPNAVFEYGHGTRSNVTEYTKSVTRDGQANMVYHIGDTPGDPKSSINTTSRATWGWMQDVVTEQFSDSTLRQALADEHARVRAYPRVLVRMTPHIESGDGRVPEPFVDYDVGDTIQFRAVHNGLVKFAGQLRVYGIRVTMDESGFERVELILEEEA